MKGFNAIALGLIVLFSGYLAYQEYQAAAARERGRQAMLEEARQSLALAKANTQAAAVQLAVLKWNASHQLQSHSISDLLAVSPDMILSGDSINITQDSGMVIIDQLEIEETQRAAVDLNLGTIRWASLVDSPAGMSNQDKLDAFLDSLGIARARSDSDSASLNAQKERQKQKANMTNLRELEAEMAKLRALRFRADSLNNIKF